VETSRISDRCRGFDIDSLTSWSILRPVRSFRVIGESILILGCDDFGPNWPPCETKQPSQGRNNP
jgi:hypothetical protein